ncbi:DJ-1/PfpI family protein [Acaryochloris sp. IP29b_bin.148]|uniref:DJ-1/PfpI family protein n=1 Tax=Acaryochloris sp. IP29b_bin.148 TaxID=2969218 RepID=UPI00262E787A|nr:DJ-1/PfpI family protein [Acaryochloris sp. IP29b_bin.148]
MAPLYIGFLIYPGVVQLDVMGAYQVLAFPPDTEMHLIGKTVDPITSNEGVTLLPSITYTDCPPLDVLCVPGGGMGQVEVMRDIETLKFLQRQGAKARYVTSVCTGSLILAAAGLLDEYQATCHWAFREQLACFGVDVVSERVVIDRDRITGAGVTSGIDLGLTLLQLLYDKATAKMAQLMMEYNPQPPFQAGSPEQAGETLTAQLLEAGKPLVDAFQLQVQKIATSV